MMTQLTVLAVIVLAAITVFQLALIFGAPLGRFAWGGQHVTLPRKLRIASISSIVLYLVFAVFITSKATVTSIITDTSVLNTGMWVITIYLLLGIPLNAISRSKPERYLMTPVVTLLAGLFLYVTLA